MADSVRHFLRAYWRDCRGGAAAETALVSLLLVTIMAQALDFGWYVYCALQVRMAAQAAVSQAAITCNNAAKIPATTNCSGITTAMETAARQVSLGSNINLGTTTEGYYCRNGNTLTYIGTSKPANCSPYSTDNPADFITQQITYTFSPLFPGLSVMSAYAGTMTSTAWMRLQ